MTNDQEVIYKGIIEELKGQLATANLRLDVATKIMDSQDTLIKKLRAGTQHWILTTGLATLGFVVMVIGTVV